MNQDARSILESVQSAATRLDRAWHKPEGAPGMWRPTAETAKPELPEIHWRRSYLPLVLLGLALATAVAAVAWLVLRSDGGASSVNGADGVPVLVSEAQLRQLAASVEHTVYWAGPRRGFRYELTTTTPGRIFVRYLPDGVAAGDPRPDFLTVGTYPGARSFADLRRAANREGVA